MSGWSQREIEDADDVTRLVQLHMRFDSLHDDMAGLREAQESIGRIERRCAARSWHGSALKALIGTAFTAMLGALAWLIVKVWG